MLNKLMNQITFQDCRESNLGLWQCPSFLFLIMGIVNITSMLGIYIVVRAYDMPELIVLSVSFVSILIFSVGSSIIKSVEQIARANKMKTEFISIASHQLRAPLSGIRWASDLLLNSKLGQLNGKQEEYLKDIQESTSRMIRLVNDLLDVTRIDSGKMTMNRQEVDLKEAVENVVKDLESFAMANNAELTMDIKGKINKVKTDPIRIRMVIQNFIDNGIKYLGGSKKGFVKLILRNRGKDVYCAVVDNGLGISQKEQGKIFEKFFRGGGVVKKQTIGTGLGLYIAKAAIESCGGSIGFSSKEGEGSTFWFTLPAIF